MIFPATHRTAGRWSSPRPTLEIPNDSMIHLMVGARRFRTSGQTQWESWTSAQRELWQPIVGAAFIVSAGFGIFGLSTFPPTQKFGLAVILGTVMAAATALLVLPYGAAAGSAEDSLA